MLISINTFLYNKIITQFFSFIKLVWKVILNQYCAISETLFVHVVTFLYIELVQFSSFTQSCLTLRPHEPQHTRPPCPSPTPGFHPNPCPLSQWCHPTISSSVILFSSCLNPYQHQGLFQWVSSSHQVAKDWSFSFNISPSNEAPGLISFRMDWLDPLADQATFKSLL